MVEILQQNEPRRLSQTEDIVSAGRQDGSYALGDESDQSEANLPILNILSF